MNAKITEKSMHLKMLESEVQSWKILKEEMAPEIAELQKMKAQKIEVANELSELKLRKAKYEHKLNGVLESIRKIE